MAAIAQTIAIVDRSGKVVSTSKQLKNVFQEAKSAYRERKAEIVADRKAKEDYELRKAIKAMSVADESRSETSRSGRRSSHTRREPELRVRPPTGDRHYSGSSVRSGRSSVSPRSPSYTSPRSPRSPYYEEDAYAPSRAYAQPSYEEDGHVMTRSVRASPPPYASPHELVRSRTDMDLALPPRRPDQMVRAHSVGTIDMDLAYGEYHPESILPVVAAPNNQQEELSSLVNKAKMLLDEAKCAQHSVKAIVAHLQKNPDAMAAVALTLAEISNVASKMAPGALSALKVGAPSVFALLAAPEFLIAVGVGLGLTVVMFGGYKIIKRIQAKNADKEEQSMDEMLEIGGDVNRIEHWRRGIADAETASVATSVEGEYITPIAAASMGHLPMDPRMREVKSGKKSKKSKKDKSERSERSSKSSSRSNSLSSGDRDKKALVKVKKPSPLRRMFHRDDQSSTRS